MLEEQAGADILKIAVMAHSPEDALAVMSATAQTGATTTPPRPMLTMAMGRAGVLTPHHGRGLRQRHDVRERGRQGLGSG